MGALVGKVRELDAVRLPPCSNQQRGVLRLSSLYRTECVATVNNYSDLVTEARRRAVFAKVHSFGSNVPQILLYGVAREPCPGS